MASIILRDSVRLVPRLGMTSYLSSSSVRSKHTLPDLPYDYNALEPAISAEIMKLHHTKHHATYVNNLNVAEEKLAEALHKGDTTAVVQLQNVIKFNGGGHINHSIFWHNLSPSGGGDPPSELLTLINGSFGSVDNLKQAMSTAAISVQGSGWAWLGYNKDAQKLHVTTTANQDPLQPTHGLVPLLGIDVWEHAYYLQYKNVRPDYVKAIWRVVNWKDVAERLHKAR
uniref:Superoxide dismutase n=1 Tax=Aceria tosichella TaxID=561515 RepID=A0A6G1SHN5_9ACAR